TGRTGARSPGGPAAGERTDVRWADMPSPAVDSQLAALDGELAVPCTGNPPKPGRIPRRGPASQAGSGWKALKAGTCAARVSEPRQVRKEAAVRRVPGGAAATLAGARIPGTAGKPRSTRGARSSRCRPRRSVLIT